VLPYVMRLVRAIITSYVAYTTYVHSSRQYANAYIYTYKALFRSDPRSTRTTTACARARAWGSQPRGYWQHVRAWSWACRSRRVRVRARASRAEDASGSGVHQTPILLPVRRTDGCGATGRAGGRAREICRAIGGRARSPVTRPGRPKDPRT
jgi:hypothetical protein